MLAEESDELSLGCRTHDLVCLQIGLICQQLPACYEYLLSEDHVLEAFNWLYHGRARAGQEFEVEVTDHVVNIIAKPGSGKAEACPKEVGEARSRRAKEERKGKKDETLSRTNVGATALRSDIELIVYYNSPSTQSQT